MLNREIVLTGSYSQRAAQIPTPCEARVQRERTVDQPNHRPNVLAESSQHGGGIGKDAWIVMRHLKRLSSKIDGPTTACFRSFSPAFSNDPQVAIRCPRQCRAVMLVNGDGLFEQSQSL